MKKKSKKSDHLIFDSIRKPTAPPSQKIGQNKPEEQVYPARRKVKHKKTESNDE